MFKRINRQQAFQLGVLHARGYKGAKRIAAFGCACSEILRREFSQGVTAAPIVLPCAIETIAQNFSPEVNW